MNSKMKVVKELWDYKKNPSIDFNTLTYGSNKIFFWLCPEGHSWKRSVKIFTRNNGKCPICSGKEILKGFNDLATVNPKLASEWHPTRNTLMPHEVSQGSEKKAWWLGACSHEWEARIDSRTTGNNCPYCKGTRVLTGFNDLASQNLSLAAEWHPTKNEDTKVDKIHKGSSRKVWWLGACGHEWEARIEDRGNGNGCSVCSGRSIQVGANDFASQKPELTKFWHPTKNIITPEETTANSGDRVWWQCEKGHEWEANVYAFSASKANCPTCINRRLLEGFNDLATVNPKLAAQWHPTKNGKLTSHHVVTSYLIPVWWQCEKGHEWEASVSSVMRKEKESCPRCSKVGVSNGEKQLSKWIGKKVVIKTSKRSIIPPFELDIYIPSKQIAIEYNGLYWHSESQGKNKWYHHNKYMLCKNQGIQLIQIWEDDWLCKQELVKGMLLHKLNLNSESKIYARNTEVKVVSQSEVSLFLNQNHIQGEVDGSLRLGLYAKAGGMLVAVMVLKKEPKANGKTLNLLRFATSQPVVGGFTKLLKAVNVMFPDVVSIVTFSDNMVSDGGLYENNGFVAVKKLKPDYMYVNKGKREHKFNYRLKRFRTDPALQYVEGLTEPQLAELNGLDRVWDAGKIKWEKTFSVRKFH